MELRNFISQALKDILGGVEDAQSSVTSGEIIPNVQKTFAAVEHGISDVQRIDFEVTVTTDESQGSEAKLSVVAAVVGGSVQGDSQTTTGSVGKLSFRVPVKFPKKVPNGKNT